MMADYGNTGADRRTGETRRRVDPPAPHGTPEYWAYRERKANDLIRQGGDSTKAGEASLREIRSARREGR